VKKLGSISDNEDKAIAFCTKKLANAPGAKLFPKGFIESAHFKENKEKNWVQVTGKKNNFSTIDLYVCKIG